MSGLINKSWISSNATIVIATVASAIIHAASAYSYFYLSKAQPAQVKSTNDQQHVISFTVIQPRETENLIEPQEKFVKATTQSVSVQEKPDIPVMKTLSKPKKTTQKTTSRKQAPNKIAKNPSPSAAKTLSQLDQTETPPRPQKTQLKQVHNLIVETTALKEIEERYITEVLNQIEKHKFYPRKARKRNIEGTVMITLAIDHNGQIASMQLTGSHKILRKAAKKAIKKTQPFSKPPASLVSPKTVSFGMTYRFRDY